MDVRAGLIAITFARPMQGPNPLSVKKKQKRLPEAPRSEGDASKVKRKRRRMRGKAGARGEGGAE